MDADKGYGLGELVDLLLAAAGNVLDTAVPPVGFDALIFRDDDAEQERFNSTNAHSSPLSRRISLTDPSSVVRSTLDYHDTTSQ
jgi:hypothetical protein